MPEFDNTKRAIGVGKLDDSARKEMFNKFVSAGGEVLKEKPDPAKEEENKRKAAELKTRQGTVSRGGTDDSRSRNRSGGRGRRYRGRPGCVFAHCARGPAMVFQITCRISRKKV